MRQHALAAIGISFWATGATALVVGVAPAVDYAASRTYSTSNGAGAPESLNPINAGLQNKVIGNKWDCTAPPVPIAGEMASGNRLGFSVEANEQWLFIGEPSYGNPNGEQTGRIQVFQFVDTHWRLHSTALREPPRSLAQMGKRLSVSGDTLMVGGQRSALIFELNETQWRQTQVLWDDGNSLVHSVGVSSDTAVFGLSDGMVHVFRRAGQTWVERQTLSQAGTAFGFSVALGGDVLVVGAPVASQQGAAVVYRRMDNQWIEETTLVASDGGFQARFGESAVTDGSKIIIGAPYALQQNGAVYVFGFDSDTQEWIETQKLTAINAVGTDYFGQSLSFFGDQLLVGAHWGDGQEPDCGAAYLFGLEGEQWITQLRLSPEVCPSGGHFGYSVALGDGVALVGANRQDNDDGNAYIYEGLRDCNGNEAFDTCDVALGLSTDCNENAIPDECESFDCNANGQPDDCDIAQGESEDCNANALPDECDIADNASDDCDANGIPDECEPDCNANGVNDVCDIANGTSQDCRMDQIPDECQPGCGTESASQTASDGAEDDYFGQAVAVFADYAVVGAPYDDDAGSNAGAVYVLRQDAGGAWIEEAKLTASDGQDHAHFGSSLALDSNALFIGAPEHPVGGKVYVFSFDGTVWAQQNQFTGFDSQEDDHFGADLCLQGNRLAVGAYGDDDLGVSAGSAYVYGFDGTQIVSEHKITAFDGAAKDLFGTSVALSDDLVIVGASEDSDNIAFAGSAYVFRFDGSQWVQEQKLLAADAASFDEFGNDVAVDGDVILVGAWRDDDAGAVYIFQHNGVSWVQETKLVSSDLAAGDHFGTALTVSSGTILVGADRGDAMTAGTGSAYVFRNDGQNWIETQKVFASDGNTGDDFGGAVALYEDTIALIGARFRNQIESYAGAVYFFNIGDCNNNGVIDSCDIIECSSQDQNNNGVPDECEQAPAALSRVASVLVHGEGEPNEAPRFHDLTSANGIEPRRGGPEAIYFEVEQDIDAATIDPESINVTCQTQTPPTFTTFLFDTNVFVVEFDSALVDQDCCTIDYAGVRTVNGAPIVGPFDIRSLEGDMNFDGAVTGGDALLIKSHLGEEVDPFFPHWDFDRSGFVTGGDYVLIKPRFGHTAPVCP